MQLPGEKILGLAKFFLGVGVPGTAPDLYQQIDALSYLENIRQVLWKLTFFRALYNKAHPDLKIYSSDLDFVAALVRLCTLPLVTNHVFLNLLQGIHSSDFISSCYCHFSYQERST